MPSKIEVKVVSDRLRVMINDTLHLSVNISELVGIQSYKYDNYRFAIDYNMKTTLIETWYVERDEWKAILDGLAALSLV